MKKVYWALVAGRPPKERGSIDFPLIRLSKGKMGKDFEKVQCISVGSAKLPPNAKAALSFLSCTEPQFVIGSPFQMKFSATYRASSHHYVPLLPNKQYHPSSNYRSILKNPHFNATKPRPV